MGTFYAVSVGPGDPELLTLKAIKTISRCGVIAYPVTQSGQSLARDIVVQVLDMSGKKELPIPITMGEKADYESAAEQIGTYLSAGEDVALLNLGDVSLYATGVRLMRILRSHGWETTMIPGVPAFCAVAARLGVALAEENEPLHIIPDADAAALDLPGTKVFMKSGSRLPKLIGAIRTSGRNGMSVKNCGLPQEEVCTDLSKTPPEAGYFVTVLVRGDIPADIRRY